MALSSFRPSRPALFVSGLLLSTTALWAQPVRITQPIDGRVVVQLTQNVSPKAQAQYDQGHVPASFQLQYVSLLLELSAKQKGALTQLLAEQRDRSSPQYHHWLTPAQYADSFGLNPADMAKIVSWLQSAGFVVNYQASARNWLAFSGDAEQFRRTFQTEIHNFDVAGEKHFANTTGPYIPAALAGIVTGIRGLDDFRLKPAHIKGRSVPRDAIRPNYTDPHGNHYLAPDDIATIYDLSALNALGYNGSVPSPVVVGQSDYTSDVSDFCYFFNLPGPFIENILYGPDPGINADFEETELDLELFAAVAPDAYILYVYSTDVFTSAQYAIDKDFGPVISMSYGGCEQENQAMLSFGESLAQEANSFGITWLAASGDTGAAGCDSASSSQATQGLAVSFPASIPEVTAVGGTEFNEGSGDYWGSTNGANGGSALSYIPEMGWNDSLYGTGLSDTLTAGGGGVSTFFTAPAWQSGPAFPNNGFRGVPDVSMAASADHDGYLVCIQPECPAYFSVYGGTSASTPVLAAMVNILNQYLQYHGVLPPGYPIGLGNINPVLYDLHGASPQVFHDITSGSNIVPCQTGTPDCPSGRLGYSAAPGYDLVTGLGSINVSNLFTAWQASIGPYLNVTLRHSGDFVQGEIGAVYTVTVTNTGSEPSTGTVNVMDGPQDFVNEMSIGGSGWNCTAPVAPTVCMNATAVPPGGSYPPLTITAEVPLNAPAEVTNQVSFWGGNSTPGTASDSAIVQPRSMAETISGQVTFSGTDLPSVVMLLNGPEINTYATDGLGNYTFIVPAGGSYNVTPSLAGYTFNPASVTFDNISANQIANFTANSITYTISGQAMLYGEALSGATVTLSGSQNGAVSTDASGNYSFTVAAGGSFTVAASLPGYYFYPYPSNFSFSKVGGNQTANFQAAILSDFNHDGHPDIIWEEPTIGWAQVWYLGGPQGISITEAANVTEANPWQIVGIGDFDGNGTPDVVWQDPVHGAVQVWYLGGPSGNDLIGAVDITTSNRWRVVSVADFNGDGHPDLLWQDPTSGFSQIWYLGGPEGIVLLGAADLDQTNPWHIVGTGYFNGDGVPDVLWQDPVSGTVQIWYMGGPRPAQGSQLISALNLTGAMTTKVVAIADFNQDGHPDVVFQDPATGTATVYYYTGAQGITPNGTAVLSAGNPWYIAGPH